VCKSGCRSRGELSISVEYIRPGQVLAEASRVLTHANRLPRSTVDGRELMIILKL
jgi:hypothetical protein